jgi:Protein of unknown function (DUF2911)/Tetratricopeptide repeat
MASSFSIVSLTRKKPAQMLQLTIFKIMKNAKTSIVLFLFIALQAGLFAQERIPLPPDGGNKKASVSEQIGLAKIDITYNRPGVKGREGKIWNTAVAHYGLEDLGHGTSYAVPWRAGANENTVITFSQAVRIEGRELPAGAYGFFISLGETESTLIFSKNSTSWGSFYYEPEADALRVTVKNQSLPNSVEWLKYDFTDQTENSVVIALSWEYRRIAFKVEADIHKIQMDAFRAYFKSTRNHTDLITAVNYCLQHNIELPQALAWMDRAISLRIMGVKNFQTLSAKAAVLFRMNRAEEAKKLMADVLLKSTVDEVHSYARMLMRVNENEEAIKVYKANYEKHPNQFVTNVGMGRAFSAQNDYKKALEYLKIALPQAPDETNKYSVETMIKKLEEGKNIN